MENEYKSCGNCKVPFAVVPFDDLEKINQQRKEKEEKSKRKRNKGTPVCEAILNLLSRLLAGGLLALPYAVLKGGIVSIVSMLVIPVICYYTGQILVDCLYEKTYNGIPFRVRSSFQEIGDACWDRYGGILTVVLQATQLVLLAAACIVLSASLVSHIIEALEFEFELAERTWIAVAALVSLPMILPKDLSQVTFLSLLSLTALMSAAVVITGYGYYSNTKSWNWSELEQFKQLPLALSIITYSNVAHGTFPTVEENLTKRSKFNKMLAITYVFSTILRITFAVNAFFCFYGNIHEIISNSLPLNTPIHVTVNGLLVIYAILSYPFVAVTIIHIMELSLSDEARDKIPPVLLYIGTRVILALVTIATAMAIPHFAILLAISGNLAAGIAFILPTVFHLRLKFYESPIWKIVLNYFVLFIGLGISVVGTIFVVKELIRVYFD